MGKSQDYWVVNFGLHYSLTYKEELEQLTAEVLARFLPSTTTESGRPACDMPP